MAVTGKKVKAELANYPDVFITPEAMEYLRGYIDYADDEVSGLGEVVCTDGALVVTGIHLLEQESSRASTEFTDDAIAKFLVECANKEIDTSTLRVWWHSHADMGVFWSTTDRDTTRGLSDNMPWLLSIVGNKAGEFLVRLDMKEPIICSMDKLELEVIRLPEESFVKQIKDELEEKVTKAAYTTMYTFNSKLQPNGKSVTVKNQLTTIPPICRQYFDPYNYEDEWDDYYGTQNAKFKNVKGSPEGFGNFIDDEVVEIIDMTVTDLDDARDYRRNSRRNNNSNSNSRSKK